MTAAIDVLFISYKRPAYTRRSLERLLAVADAGTRVWAWHNGPDRETLEVVRGFEGHPRLHRLHASPRNEGLRTPTNWLWQEARGELFGKVDDDCLLPEGWAAAMRAAHAAEPRFGALTCWHHAPEDLDARLYRKKLRRYGGVSIMQNCWVNGSGYTVKRAAVEQQGLLREGQTWSEYCIDLALRGWIHGWLHPFLFEEHMDDPRSLHSLLRSDEDIRRHAPLSAQANGVDTLAAWVAQHRRSARLIQKAPLDPRRFRGWRRRLWGPEIRRLLGYLVGRRRAF